MDTTLERLPQVLRRYGRSRSAFYSDIERGVMVPSVQIGPRCSAWPAHEIDAVISARIAGRSEDEIRALVQHLVAERRERA